MCPQVKASAFKAGSSREIRGISGLRISLLFSLALFLLPVLYAWGADNSSYLASILEEAHEKELHEEKYWHTLLHYKKGLFGTRSLIDDPLFFLAPDGKYNPRAELDATIKAFFTAPDEGGKPAVCRFTARYAWLRERLGLDPSRLPVPECRHFTDLIDEIRPESVSLVFPAAHINSPASMFGHTFLTVETAPGNRLLAHAINYSAATPETFGPFFAVKGLLGLYKGYFSILPYYAKIQEYSDFDKRDIWEYHLNLSKEETVRLLMHVYELDSIYSDYYFFDENCSYDLLFLLDAARPSLDLTDRTGWWVVPLDTIRIVKEKGMVTEVTYRPSQTSKIEAAAAPLTRKDRETALSLAKGKAEAGRPGEQGIPKKEQAEIYDLAGDYLQYLYTRKELPKEDYLGRFLSILKARSTLGETEEKKYVLPEPPRPDEGHGSGRLSFGAGSKGGKPFQEIRYRPVYHDLIDNGKGYQKGAQIIFGETAVRYYSSDNKVKLESLDFIDILSLAPRDLFFRPISWKVRTGLTQRIMEDGNDHLIYRLNPGGGFAHETSLLGLSYFMMESDLGVGGAFSESYALGAGASMGSIKNLTESWKVHFYGRNIYYGLGDRFNLFEAALVQNFSLSRDSSISVGLTRSRTREFYQTEFRCSFNVYF